MFSKTLSFLFIAVFVAVESYSIGYYDSGNADTFVDQVLNGVKSKYNKTLDPFHIPDQVVSFHKKIVIDWHGEAKLTEGVVKGLAHIVRSGPSTMGTENGHFTAHLQLGDNNVSAHFKAEAKFMDLHSHLTLDTQIGNIDIKATIGVDAKGKPAITALDVDELKHVKIDIHGPIKPLDHLVDGLGEAFIKVFNPVARNLISKVLKDVIGKELQNFKIPGTF